MEGSTSFSPSHYFPQRRRALQACLNCGKRKTRCDAVKPKCGLCVSQGVDCVYRDSSQPRIEQNTRVLLERIQLLEDRLLSSPVFNAQYAAGASPPSLQLSVDSQHSIAAYQTSTRNPALNEVEFDVQISLSHTANANHVYDWPIVRRLLGETQGASIKNPINATDVFFDSSSTPRSVATVPESWKLFQDGVHIEHSSELLEKCRSLIVLYFKEVNTFFPLLSIDDVVHTLEDVARNEIGAAQTDSHLYVDVSLTNYLLLLLVLSLASFVLTDQPLARLDRDQTRMSYGSSRAQSSTLDEQLWNKAQLLLGFVSTELALEAAQCTMLASIYMGARGHIAASFHWSHITAVKCEALVRRGLVDPRSNDGFSDAFRRLYWVAFIYEGDFISEISITLPSGIARYEDLVPYPDFNIGETRHESESPDIGADDVMTGLSSSKEELIAFQISTNAAIRRFLNRVNSVVYDSKEQYRMARPDYATWLLRITSDLWAHHSAVYNNLPDFLLTSKPGIPSNEDPSSPSTPGFIRSIRPTNNPWNVLRIQGRYHAGKYIIFRPFIEYVCLNLSHFDTHPSRVVILEKCRLCLEGCQGFIKVFDTEPANSITCLFATGMV